MNGRIGPDGSIERGSCAPSAAGQNRDEKGRSGCDSGCDQRPGFWMRIWCDGSRGIYDSLWDWIVDHPLWITKVRDADPK